MAVFKTNNKVTAKKDTIIFDFLRKIENSTDKYKALIIAINKLENHSLRSAQRQSLIDMFDVVVKKSGGEIFSLPNDDLVIIFDKELNDEILACLIKVQFIFHDDPLVKKSVNMEQGGLAVFYPLGNGAQEFREAIQEIVKNAETMQKEKPKAEVRPSSIILGNRRLRKDLTPNSLAKMQKALTMMDFSSLIRRQSVCAVIGKSPPQMIFDEVYVSIADLRDMLMPDVDLTSNLWLFLYLTETLDKRVLVNVSRHDDGSLTNNFSLNLNVSTILSDEFLEFDANINQSQRSTIVLELQLADIFSDIKAFILAKTFAQYRGYKICIDGITVDKLKYINREHLDGDLLKIIWHPSFMDIINEDKHFTDYVNKAERSRMILCRVDDAQAVEVGNSLGINLYQGRYIQRLLAANPRKTLYNIKK